MGLIAAKCTQCGANIQIDDTKEAGICEFCGTAFITEKAINNYNISTDNVVINSENVNIYNNNIDSSLEAIDKFIGNGLYDAAIELINQVIEEYPYDYRGWWQMALVDYNVFGEWFDDNINYQKALALADDPKIIKEYRDSKYKEYKDNERSELLEKIETIDPLHDATDKKGCYIATCVYGSYDCPEVWTLRRFRDHILDATWYGKIFIRFYYTVSPVFVKWFGETKIFKSLFEKILNKLILSLNKKGIKNTSYKDKY